MSSAPNDSTASSPWLKVGYISRAHGLKGALIIKTFDPTSTAIGEVDRVLLTPKEGAPKEFELETLRDGPGGDLLMELEGVHSREAAEALIGSTIAVHREEIDQPEEGEFFQGDLIGLTAVTPDGKPLGTVVEVWTSAPVPNLVLKLGEQEEMIPFAEDFVVKVDLASRTIVLRPLEYDQE